MHNDVTWVNRNHGSTREIFGMSNVDNLSAKWVCLR